MPPPLAQPSPSFQTTSDVIALFGAGSLVPQASVSDDVIARLRQQVSARDLVFEKVDADTGGGKVEKAAYVVNPSPASDSRLVVDVSLKHN